MPAAADAGVLAGEAVLRLPTRFWGSSGAAAAALWALGFARAPDVAFARALDVFVALAFMAVEGNEPWRD